MHLDQLKELLPLLRLNSVSHFKMEGLEISFLSTLPEVTEEVKAPPPTPEPFQAPDLKTDELFDYDKVLNWSGSADLDPMPLANDEILVAP